MDVKYKECKDGRQRSIHVSGEINFIINNNNISKLKLFANKLCDLNEIQVNTDPMKMQTAFLEVVIPPDIVYEETSGGENGLYL